MERVRFFCVDFLVCLKTTNHILKVPPAFSFYQCNNFLCLRIYDNPLDIYPRFPLDH
jgi:hypothetical protein